MAEIHHPWFQTARAAGVNSLSHKHLAMESEMHIRIR